MHMKTRMGPFKWDGSLLHSSNQERMSRNRWAITTSVPESKLDYLWGAMSRLASKTFTAKRRRIPLAFVSHFRAGRGDGGVTILRAWGLQLQPSLINNPLLTEEVES